MQKSILQLDLVTNHAKALASISAATQMTQALKAFQTPALASVAEQYQDLFSARSAAERALESWRDEEFKRQDEWRKLISPVSEIQKSFDSIDSWTHLTGGFSVAKAFRDQIRLAQEQFSANSLLAKTMAEQGSAMRRLSNTLAESMKAGSAIQDYLKDFERINKQWQIPDGLLGFMQSFKSIQEQLGKVTLPTIDVASAYALADVLGKEGIEEQLSLLGIRPDGTFQAPAEPTGRGILSRKQSDVIALIGLLLAILIPLYQELMNHLEKSGEDDYKAQIQAAMKIQAQRIASLNFLIEESMERAAQEPEEKFVVRERVAKVRMEPKNGSTVEGEVLPNEVVYPVSRRGKWVEVEYYHWRQGKWQTGWVLKKYLERVPANYANANSRRGRR